MGELARLKAVTERVLGSNHGTFSKSATAHALSGSPLARQLPHRGSQGRLRRRIPTGLPLGRAGEARPLALPLGELARLKAVTERVPGSNQRTNLQICYCIRPLSLAVGSTAPP